MNSPEILLIRQPYKHSLQRIGIPHACLHAYVEDELTSTNSTKALFVFVLLSKSKRRREICGVKWGNGEEG